MIGKIAQGILTLVVIAALAVCLAVLPGAVARNNADSRSYDAAMVMAGEAAYSRYAIDLTRESGIRLRLPRISHDNYLSLTLGANDTYRAEFSLGGEAVGSFVIDSGPWAAIADAAGGKPISHLIPAYIVAEGYDELSLLPLRGDGEYWAANVATQQLETPPRTQEANIIDFEIRQVEIMINDKHFEKIEAKREQAIKVGVLLSDDSDIVPAKITAEGKRYDSDLRLKGDWTDHLTGDKWSFRIELRGDYAVYGMQKFSVQPPATRHWIYERMIYEFYREQGGVALRYDFADVYVNGEYKGVYALEEFMEKRVIENSAQREGPIARWEENIYPWERWAIYDNGIDTGFTPKPLQESRPPDATAILGVFSAKKTLENPSLTGYAQYAIDLINRVWAGELPAAQVFDAGLFAKYYVVLDIFQAAHGQGFGNMRSYYNPITAKIEPIPFDELASMQVGRFLSTHGYGEIDRMLFASADFQQLYLKYARELSDKFPGFLAAHDADLQNKALIIRRDEYVFGEPYDINWLNASIAALRGLADPGERLAPTAELADGVLTITNNDIEPLIVTGIYDGDDALPLDILPPDLLPLTIANVHDSGTARIELPYLPAPPDSPDSPDLQPENLSVAYEYLYTSGGLIPISASDPLALGTIYDPDTIHDPDTISDDERGDLSE
ncbi:MAG: CotH kinase family protein [Peptococcaceae bacterium]|jgi:hypothetical protein|nr:CotH kinase family protein [Peptococcaceae bacterium]